MRDVRAGGGMQGFVTVMPGEVRFLDTGYADDEIALETGDGVS
jgi:hypothetical protein